MNNKLTELQGWALFIDRDGVINERITDDYVKQPDEFHLIHGVLDAFAKFAAIFNPVIVVTNQQGIGRGLMSISQLNTVHDKMLQEIVSAGGKIDAVFFSPDLKNTRSFTRKPAIGMGLKARKQFPSIRFKKSVMIGDSYSDILFGYRLGMVTVLIGTDKDVTLKCAGILDYSFPDLISFAGFIENISQ